MANDFDEMLEIFKKVNDTGSGFFVARRKDGSVDWKKFDRDPLDDWYYDSTAGEWIAKGGADAENNLSVSGDRIAASKNLGAKLTPEEQSRLVANWEEAASQYDSEHGASGFVSPPNES